MGHRPTITKEMRDALKTRAACLLQTEEGRITYGAISRGTGLHVTHICKIFCGHRRPSLSAATRIAAYLGVTIERLMAALKL